MKPGGGFEVSLRFYSPQKPLFESSWRLPDIEADPVNQLKAEHEHKLASGP